MKPKNFFFILSTSFFISYIQAQTPQWDWAKSSVGFGDNEGYAVATDKNSNVYITGSFNSDSIAFGNIILYDTFYPEQSFFIVKYAPSGNVTWAKTSNTWSGDGTFLATDANENIYMVGNATGLSNLPNKDYSIVIKYDSLGNIQWQNSVAGNQHNTIKGITTDKSGNAIITGFFSGDSIIFGTTTLYGAYNRSLFIAKYSPVGTLIWAKVINAHPGSIEGDAITSDDNNNIYITGSFESDSISLGNNIFLGASTSNTVFIAKYDSMGNALWAEREGQNQYAIVNAITTDNNTFVYITGAFFNDSISFGSYSLHKPHLNSMFFIAKFDFSGNIQWLKGPDSAYSNIGYSLACAPNGNIYISGGFTSIFSFDSITLTPPTGSTDPMLIMSIDPNGKVICADALASGGDDQNGVCVDYLGNAYIGDDFEDSVFKVGKDTLRLTKTGAFVENIFVAKYHCSNSNPTTGIEIVTTNPITVYPNPSNGSFNFSGVPQGSNIEVYNLLGQEVSSTHTSDNITTINISGNSKGVYFYKVTLQGIVLGQGKLVLE